MEAVLPGGGTHRVFMTFLLLPSPSHSQPLNVPELMQCNTFTGHVGVTAPLYILPNLYRCRVRPIITL